MRHHGLAVLVLAGIVTLLGATAAGADTMYVYTGNPFTYGHLGMLGPLPGGCPPNTMCHEYEPTPYTRVSGSFTVAEPLRNRAFGDISTEVLSFSFAASPAFFPLELSPAALINSDNATLTAAQFAVATDADGTITAWSIGVGALFAGERAASPVAI